MRSHEEGSADSQNVERTLAPRVSSSKWTLRSSFIGPQGIRSGWSMLIFIVILMVEVLVTRVPVNHLLHSMKLNPSLEPWSPALAAGILALLVLVSTAVMAKIEARPVLFYGFIDKRRLSRFMLGVAGGVVALSALVLALKMSGWLIFDGRALHGASAWSYGLQWGVAFLLTALFEESLLRGYLQSALTRGVGFWWAAVLLSLAFGATHLPNHGESPIGILSVVGAGLLFCLSLWLTKSLYWAVGLHAGWDWSQSYLYGVPDSGQVASGHLFTTHSSGGLIWSGGPTGPEGSLYVLPTMAIIALAVWIAWNQKGRHNEPAAV
ncbi:MAG: CPBP family intramembrane glutamic endopeptidase [Candidatus Sulfotelmatobacter sp.]